MLPEGFDKFFSIVPIQNEEGVWSVHVELLTETEEKSMMLVQMFDALLPSIFEPILNTVHNAAEEKGFL